MGRNTAITAIALAVVVAALSGCGPSYSCKDSYTGVQCQSLSAVYDKEVLHMGGPQEKASSDKEKAPEDKGQVKVSPEEEVVRNLEITKRAPIRVLPKVISIWIAPWEDGEGDLHKPELIWSDISDRRNRWLFGEKAPEDLLMGSRLMKLEDAGSGDEEKGGPQKKEDKTAVKPQLQGQQRPQPQVKALFGSGQSGFQGPGQ